MNFHEMYVLIENKRWIGDPPEHCNVCGAEFEPKDKMPEFVFYDVNIPPCPHSEDKAWELVQAIVNNRRQDGDTRSPNEIIDYLAHGDGKFPGWLKWPRSIWGHICEACHSAFNQTGHRLLGQRYAVGGDRGKMGEA